MGWITKLLVIAHLCAPVAGTLSSLRLSAAISCNGDLIPNGAGTECVCPTDFIRSGNHCNCPPGKSKVGNTCVCSGELIPDGNNGCTCPSGFIVSGNHCNCPTDKHKAGNTCVCDGDLQPNGGGCACPAGQIRITFSSQCRCPNNKVKDGNTCKCPGQLIDPGTGVCGCPVGYVQDGNQCCCPDGMKDVGGTCVCDGDLIPDGRGGCGCPAGQTRDGNSNQCRCPNNKVKDGTTCKCKGNLIDPGTGVCGCPVGFIQNGNQCSCPNGKKNVGDTCVCDGDLVSDGNNGCTCPTGQVPDGNSNQCRCPNNQIKVGTTCQCNGNLQLNTITRHCECPAGHKLISGSTTQCLPNGQCWSPGETCRLNSILGSTCNLAIPLPSDNYVDNGRVNKYDDTNGAASFEPFINIKSTAADGTISETGDTTWAYYGQHRTSVQNRISFASPGLYTVSIDAWDYNAHAECTGCVAVNDDVRPSFAANACPVSPGSSPHQLASITSLAAAESSFDDGIKRANWDNNAGSEAYCNTIVYKTKDFHADETDLSTSVTELSDAAGSCFGATAVTRNVDALKLSPLTSELQTPATSLNSILQGKCKWQCTKSLTLQETVTTYQCPDISSSSCMEGATCSFDASIEATSADIATIRHELPVTVQDASNRVIAGLPPNAATSYDPVNHVYRSVPCTSFDGSATCQFTSKLSDLVTVTPNFAANFPAGSNDASDFIFYRYNLDGRTWHDWDQNNDELSFGQANQITTDVVIQAWTACGLVEEFTLSVSVYLHSSLTCSTFKDLFTGVREVVVGGAYCTLPHSDYTVFHLKYSVGDIMPSVQDQVTGTFSNIKCEIRAKEEDSPALADTSFATLFERDASSPNIDEDFAVQLVNSPHTAQKTTFDVKCTVTRTLNNNLMLANDQSESIGVASAECLQTFTIMDCDAPELDSTPASVCQGSCSQPSLYEVCLGSFVTSTSTATTVTNYDASTQCCNDCAPALECVKVDTSTSATLGRCKVPGTIELMAAEETKFSNGTLLSLLGTSALVAIVALVAVKRRTEARVKEADDAYYPLLE